MSQKREKKSLVGEDVYLRGDLKSSIPDVLTIADVFHESGLLPDGPFRVLREFNISNGSKKTTYEVYEVQDAAGTKTVARADLFKQRAKRLNTPVEEATEQGTKQLGETLPEPEA